MKKTVTKIAAKTAFIILAFMSVFTVLAKSTYAANPTVTTNPANGLGVTSATLNATAPTAGSSPITSRGFEYGLTSAYGSNTSESVTPSYSYQLQWGNNPSANGQMMLATDVVVSRSGDVYVADSYTRKVQKFDSSGNFIAKWGHHVVPVPGESEDYFFSTIGCLSIDSQDNIYVTDSDLHVVKKFSSSGAYLSQLDVSGSCPAFDSADNIYVVDSSEGNVKIKKFDSSGNFLTQWGSIGSGNGQFGGASLDIAFDSLHNIYITDITNDRVQKFDQNGTYLTKWGQFGEGNGEFNDPINISIDSSNNVFVLEYHGNHRVQKFDSSGNFITKWGSPGSGDSQFNQPRALAINKTSGNMYVADTETGRVQMFNNNGVYQTQWGHSPSANGQFQYPLDITVDSSNNVYVADTYNHRIQKFNSNGVYQLQWGGQGYANGKFSYPQGIATDSSGNVYVSDSDNNRIQKFDQNGTYLMQFGSYGTGDGQVKAPKGIAIDASGNIYVADEINNRIQKFNSSGEYVTQWGTAGSENSQFNSPKDIAIDGMGNVYVADLGNSRIQQFDQNGVYIRQWGSPGGGNSQFGRVSGIATDSWGNIYTADSGYNRIQKFDSEGNFITKWGSQNTGDGNFGGLSNVTVNSLGDIFTTDLTLNRVQKFSPASNAGDFSANLTNLTCNTTYHYQAYATNTEGTSEGDDETFTTSACPTLPTAQTGDLKTDPSEDSVTVRMAITGDGGGIVTAAGVEYGTSQSYGQQANVSYIGATSYLVDMYDLTCGTTYHYRAFVTNEVGTGYGDDETFTTDHCPQPYDLRLRGSLLNTEPVKAGDTVHYQLKLKNLGPGSSYGSYFYINIPEEASFNNATFSMPDTFEGWCEDNGPINESEIGGSGGYTGTLVLCIAGSEDGAFNGGDEISIDFNLTATADFTEDLTVLRGLAFYPDFIEADIAAIFQAFEEGAPLFSIPSNNVINLIYGQSTDDTDSDGTPDTIESAAPNNGDANNDSTPDSEQSNVTSLIDPVTGKYATLAVDDQCEVSSLTIASESLNATQDKSNDYPNGLMDFTLNCGTSGYVATINQYYYGTTKDGFTVRKYNPTTQAYTTINDASISQTTIGNQTATLATYQVKDGGVLDLDGLEDGNIHDPAGLAKSTGGLAGTGMSTLLITGVSIGITSTAGLVLLGWSKRRHSFYKQI